MLSSSLVAVIPNGERSYSCATVLAGLVVGAAATDFFTVTGKDGFIQRIQRVIITGVATAAQIAMIAGIKRSTANTAGTATSLIPVLRDATGGPPQAAAPGQAPTGLNTYLPSTALVQAYTVPPTVGTATPPQGGTLFNRPLSLATVSATVVAGAELFLDFTTDGNLALPTLRGSGDVFALNFNGATIAGATVNVSISFTETAAQPGALA